jgi:hypothetical protein
MCGRSAIKPGMAKSWTIELDQTTGEYSLSHWEQFMNAESSAYAFAAMAMVAKRKCTIPTYIRAGIRASQEMGMIKRNLDISSMKKMNRHNVHCRSEGTAVIII